MSLHVLANHMASKGRDGDSMLVHMTPGEVHGLQALAMKHGGSLTVNPDTGLPEANFLKSLLPMLAGFALGPAGFGLVSSAMGAGALVGGITGIATGSLSKGLMAGLGAYGGFGIGESLATAGAGALTDSAASSAYGASAGMTDAAAQELGFASAEEAAQNAAAQAAKSFDPSQVAGFDKATAGFNAATSSGSAALDFAKNNKLALGMAAAPIIADQMVPTTTKAPTPMAPGRIREKRWDGRQFVDVASTDAGVYNTSGRNFSDLYRGYNNGGIVALAEGGVPGYATGGVSDADIFKYFQTPNLSDTQIAADMQKYGVSAADIARATGTQNQQTDYEKRFVNTLIAPGTDASEFQKATSAVGLQNQALATAMQNAGLSQGAQYALTQPAQNDIGFTGGIIDSTTGKPVDLYNQIGYTAGALPGDQAGLEGLYGNINYVTKGLQNLINTGKMTVADAQNAALAELARTKVSVGDVKAATGKDFGSLFLPKQDATQRTTTTVTTPTDIATAAGTALPVGVSGAGITTINPNGTVTTRPNIPGIPVGGFTGMKNLRDVYTAGGGDLGYTSPMPTSLEAFNKTYVTDRMSGDSLAAYNYLAGKGGAKYPTKSGVGQISEDYATAVLGYPARGNLPYIYNKATGKMDVNPDYVAPGRDSSGNVTYSMSLNDIKSSLKDTPLSGQALYDWAKSNNLSAQQIADATGRSLSSVYADFRAGSKAAADKTADAAKGGDTIQVTDSSGYNTETITATKQADGTYLGSNGKKYDASGKSIMAVGGMTGYAVGGGLGSLGSYSDGGRLLKGPGDGVSDSIPATIGRKQQPARLADGEFVVPARIVSELGNGSTDAGAKKLYAMMDRVQRARGKTTGKNKVAANSRADKYLPA
jgi:hypothetical protein